MAQLNDSLEARVTELQAESQTLAAEKQTLTDHLAAAEAAAAELHGDFEEQLESLHEDNRRLEAERGSAREELESRETDRDQLTTANALLTSEIVTLREHLTAAEATTAATRANLDGRNTELADLEKSLEESQAEATQAAQSNDSLGH